MRKQKLTQGPLERAGVDKKAPASLAPGCCRVPTLEADHVRVAARIKHEPLNAPALAQNSTGAGLKAPPAPTEKGSSRLAALAVLVLCPSMAATRRR